ncbi:UNVERIFIED_CONTAM: F-box/WD repeat-containing protein 4, partial [Gekko kuhli]
VEGIPVKERVKVSQNWRRGRCQRNLLLKWKRNLMPWMQLDSEYLYLSQAEDIQAYWLRPNHTGLQRGPQAVFSGHQEDVCRFVLANGHIVSGGGDGNIALHKLNSSFSFKFLAHEQEVNCVDCQGGIIVSGSRDRTAKRENCVALDTLEDAIDVKCDVVVSFVESIQWADFFTYDSLSKFSKRL